MSAKVTGAARYTADIRRPGMLVGAVLRSPLPHARIVHIDVEAARRAAGVHAVLIGADLPRELVGRSLADVPVLCTDVVRWIGDHVAAVAAETPEHAQAALELIDVAYAELPAAFSPEEALRLDAFSIHPEFMAYRGAPARAYAHPNLCAHEVLTRGDVETGFAQADLVLEHVYFTPPQHQGYLESHSAVVEWTDDKHVRVWASNKAPFLLRDELARVLQLPREQVVVEPVAIGGDFGGKGSAMEIPLAAHLARASRRPVRIVLSPVEEMTATNPRHAATIRVRTGLCRDGRLLARSVRVEFDGGAYAGYKPIPGANLAGRFWSVGPYRIPHVRFESAVAYTNNPPAGHMRAPGEVQLMFATEVDMDRCAEAIGMDPLRFRQLNAVENCELGPLGEAWQGVRLQECLASAAAHSDWDSPRRPNIGRGAAVTHCAGGLGASDARVEIGSDGRARVFTGTSDQGSGAHEMLTRVVARELDLPLADVELVVGSTDDVPFDSGSSASRVTYVAGTAVQRAAAEARARRAPSTPSTQPIEGKARFEAWQLSDTPSFAALVAEVEVDPDTGAFRVLQLNGAYDVGTVIDPVGMDGQLQGGLIQGLGFATMEEVRRADGRVETVSFGDYKLPTIADVPPHQAALITDGEGAGPFGAKSVGELTIGLAPAAIANAIHDALGVWITELPVSAERVFRALHPQEGHESRVSSPEPCGPIDGDSRPVTRDS